MKELFNMINKVLAIQCFVKYNTTKLLQNIYLNVMIEKTIA